MMSNTVRMGVAPDLGELQTPLSGRRLRDLMVDRET
jgi:hypothetical protein